jgi:CHAD domain-containing protein
MAAGKWISDLTAATPLADAARWVLAVRLEVVRDYLLLALREPEKDVEYVHQLRVGTRRAGAAVEIFRPCLPDNDYKRARQQLRTIRRAAGEARDWDVFLLSLKTAKFRRTAPHQPGLDFLFGYAFAQRVAAQDRLDEASPKPPFGFERLLAETVAAVRQPSHHVAGRKLLNLARPLLFGLVQEFNQAAHGEPEAWEHLHQVRILGKRLRYAMEVVADCFAAPFREEIYPAVEEMQEILGRANDSQVASQRLLGLRNQLRSFQPQEWKRLRAGIEALAKYHQERLPQERQNFIAWWSRWQKAQVEEALTTLLKASPHIRQDEPFNGADQSTQEMILAPSAQPGGESSYPGGAGGGGVAGPEGGAAGGAGKTGGGGDDVAGGTGTETPGAPGGGDAGAGGGPLGKTAGGGATAAPAGGPTGRGVQTPP